MEIGEWDWRLGTRIEDWGLGIMNGDLGDLYWDRGSGLGLAIWIGIGDLDWDWGWKLLIGDWDLRLTIGEGDWGLGLWIRF